MITADEFRQLLLTESLDTIARAHVLGGPAFAFRDDMSSYTAMVDHLVERLGVQPAGVTVVGSAKVGFSLNPIRFPRSFHDESDIDVLIVDQGLFDAAWYTMLDWNYLRRHKLPAAEWRWARQRREELLSRPVEN